MLTQNGISPKLYGAVIGGALIWVLQAVLGIDANHVDIVAIGSQHVTLASILTTVGVAIGAYVTPHSDVQAVPPDDSKVDVAAGNPSIPAEVAAEEGASPPDPKPTRSTRRTPPKG